MGKFILSAFALSILASCGGSKSDSNPDGKPNILYTNNSLQKVIESSILICGESECPQEVVKIMLATGKTNSKGENQIANCSGYLINSDTVMTNGHCVPEAVDEETVNCGYYLVVKNQDGEIAKCKSVHKVEHRDNIVGQDYAIFKIDRKLKARDAEFDRTGLKNNELVYGMVIDHAKSAVGVSWIRKADCKVIHNTILTNPNPKYDKNFSHSVYIADREQNTNLDFDKYFVIDKEERIEQWDEFYTYGCKVISGNSGSALFSESDDKIKGIISHKIQPISLRNEIKKDYKLTMTGHRNPVQFGIATNISCIGQELDNKQVAKKCPEKSSESLFKIETDNLAQEHKLISTKEKDLPGADFIKWGNKPYYSDRSSFYVRPFCIETSSVEYLEESRKSKDYNIILTGRIEKKARIIKTIDPWFRINYDNYSSEDMRPIEIGVSLEFNALKLEKNRTVNAKLIDLDSKKYELIDLDICQ